ncbi:Putative phage tail protein [Devosia enhydra]|uniref:Putative phage tail protein n=1 Tax=Devosia enhydra TaxID=665118 RepID=A0A1K2I0V1_9HYPH|nr:hypothetical protein [Devosia enhydra]SFZ86010.1 Putative phage tail protein [Devosia enhydra]
MAELIIADRLAPVSLELACDGRQSVADLVRAAGFSPLEWGRMAVTIDEHPIPRDLWARVRPKPIGIRVMRVAMMPAGDGAGGGGVLRTVLTVLLVAGAIALTSGAAAFALGGAGGLTLFAAGSFEASLAAAAVLGLGQAGLNALFPSAVQGQSQQSGTTLGSAGVRQNVLAAGDYLPRPFGRTKLWPPQVTKPIRYLQGRDEVVEALYAVAGRTVLEDIRIGGVPASEVEGVTVQTVDWTSPLETQTLLQQYGAMKAVGRPLAWYVINKNAGDDLFDQNLPERSSPAWDMVSLPALDEARIRLAWTEGLAKKNDNAATVYQPLRLRIRPRGATSWLNLPEIWFSNNATGEAYRKDIILRRGTPGPAPTIRDAAQTAIRAFARTPGQGRYGLVGNGISNGTGSSDYAGYLHVEGGSGTAIVARGCPTLTSAPANGSVWRMRALQDNGGAATTIAIDGLAPISISGTLLANTDYDLTYSAGSFSRTPSASPAPFQGVDLAPTRPDWVAASHFISSMPAGNGHIPVLADQNVQLCDEGVIIWLDGLVDDVPLELGLIAGAVTLSTNFNFTRYAQPHWSWGGWNCTDMFGYGEHPGHAAKYAPRDMQNNVGLVAVNELAVIRRQPPTIGLSRSDCALIAVRGRNVQVGEVTAIATSVIHDRQSEDWLATDNPAKLSEALARGQSTNRPLSATIDTAAYDAWAAECVAKGYRTSFESAGAGWDDVQKMLASAARGGFAMAGSWRPYFDRDRSAEDAVFVFSPMNARYLGLSRAWAPLPTDALRITWRDEAEDYQERSTLVYAQGVTAASARGLEDVRYPEIPTEALAIARARYDLALMRYRATRQRFETDHAGEAVRKGDLVLAVWDMLAEIDETHGVNERAINQSAYVRSVTRNLAGQVTAIALEQPVYVEPSTGSLWDVADLWETGNILTIGNPYVAAIAVGRAHPADPDAGVVVSLDLDAAEAGVTDSVVVTPASVPHSERIVPGQMVTVGRRQRLGRRALVESIVPSGPLFTVTVVPEAPEVFA